MSSFLPGKGARGLLGTAFGPSITLKHPIDIDGPSFLWPGLRAREKSEEDVPGLPSRAKKKNPASKKRGFETTLSNEQAAYEHPIEFPQLRHL